MDNQFMESLFSRLKAANALNSQKPGTTGETNTVKFMQFGEALETSVKDSVKREKLFSEMIAPVLSKYTRTPDISHFRMATVSERMEMRRNNQTVFLNYLESQGAPQIVTDIQHKFREWNIGDDEAEVFGMEEALPGEVTSNRAVRDNTLTCVGAVVQIGMLTQEMLEQQAQIDLMNRELDFTITRIRRKMNALLVSSVENKGEGQFSIPQLGGFVTRSILYNVAAGGSDLTRSLIQGRIDAIANEGDPEAFNYGLPLLALTNNRQIGVLRDIIISEYNGIDPMTRVQFETLLRSRLAPFNVNVEMVFEPIRGQVLPFAVEPDLPTGTTIIFDADKPRLALMRLMNSVGPWYLQRPTDRLVTKNVMWNLFSLEDPLVDTRSLITGHAS